MGSKFIKIKISINGSRPKELFHIIFLDALIKFQAIN